MSTMYQEPKVRVWDNPLLIAQAQRQFRKKQLTMSLFIASALSLLVLLVCFQSTQSTYLNEQQEQSVWLGGQKFLYFMLFIALYWRGTSALIQSISEERKSGIFTFLRSTPLSPHSLTLGYLIGVNVRGYCIAGVIAPFWIGCSIAAGMGQFNALISYFYIILGAFTIHTIILAYVLHTSGRTQKWGSLLFVLAIWFMAIPLDTAGLHTLSHMTPLPALASLAGSAQIFEMKPHVIHLFGFSLSSEIYTLIVQGIVISISIWVAARRMERDDQAVMSRPGSILVMLAIMLLLIGCDFNPINRFGLDPIKSTLSFGVIVQVVCIALSCYIIFISAPSRISFIRAARRRTDSSSKSDAHQLIPWYADGSSLLPLTLVLIGISSSLVALFFGMYGADKTALTSLITHDGMLTMLGSTGLFLLFFSGICEYIESNSHHVNQRLALLTTLVIFFLFPLILALIFKEPMWCALSPGYSVVYGFISLGLSMTTLDQVTTQVFVNNYMITSLAISGGVALICYIKSNQLRSQSLEHQTVGDGD